MPFKKEVYVSDYFFVGTSCQATSVKTKQNKKTDSCWSPTCKMIILIFEHFFVQIEDFFTLRQNPSSLSPFQVFKATLHNFLS